MKEPDLGLIARAWRVRGGLANEACVLAVALWGGGVAGLALLLVVRPAAYTYFWACAMVMAPVLALVFAHYLDDVARPALGRAVVGIVVLLAWGDPLRNLVGALALPAKQRPDVAYEAIRAVVPPQVPVAITARYWYAFQDRNPWRNALFLIRGNPALLDSVDWLVLREGSGADYPRLIEDFELLLKVPSEADVDLTYAFSVWQRRSRARVR